MAMFDKKQNGGGMPAGIAMMIKSLLPGFDPEDFGRKIEEVRNGAAQTVRHFDARLEILERNQAVIGQKLDAIAALLEVSAGVPKE
jgi:hypothetical protein